ncbi:hypothetical protein PENTCL1PPCAC_11026, partial [Pristionchus entomophagus]
SRKLKRVGCRFAMTTPPHRRMRSLLAIALLFAVVHAATKKQAFDNKFKKIVSTYLDNNLAKATTLVNDQLVDQKSFEDIADVLMSNVMTLVPVSKYISALSMLTTFESCIKKTGLNMTAGMEKLGTAFKKILNAPYNKIINKMKTMKKNKKPIANMRNQAYVISTSAMTKALVQKIINNAKQVVTKDQYACALGPLNTIMMTNLYQMDYAKTG